MHIYTCNLIARFMQSDPGWKMDLVTNRVAFGIKISDTIDYEWINQPFVVRGNDVRRGPTAFAKSVMYLLQTYGAWGTVKRISRRILIKVGLRRED
jgi:hypothetical protein